MQTDELIESLAARLQPVRRMRAPVLRALLWLAVVGAVAGGFLLLHKAGLNVFMQRVAVPRVAVECVGTGLTAITAVVAAFELSVPGRSPRWAYLPVPPLLLWLAASGLGCLSNGWSLYGTGGIRRRELPVVSHSSLLASLPLATGLFWMLRRARPIAPLPVATLGTLGVAATAAFILEFFHPFDVTVIDLTLHLAAIGLVMLIGTLWRRPLLAVTD